jgi:integrase
MFLPEPVPPPEREPTPMRLVQASNAPSFADFATTVLDQRDLDGVRSIRTERRAFAKHLAASPLARHDIARIRVCDIVKVIQGLSRTPADDARIARVLAPGSVKKIKNLVNAVMVAAVEAGLREDNPCREVQVRTKENRTEEPWTYLTLAEQKALANAEMSTDARLLILFALGTGLRQGEQWNLEMRDLVVTGPEPHVTVRFGSRGLPPKNGRIRRVPLFGIGLDAATRWLEVRLAHDSPLVFPTVTGCRRLPGAPSDFGQSLASAGITRHVRWHDLRHSCASSLASGWWGPRWDLIDVRDLLGHSSIHVTERYAHLGDTGLKAMAAKTGGLL